MLNFKATVPLPWQKHWARNLQIKKEDITSRLKANQNPEISDEEARKIVNEIRRKQPGFGKHVNKWKLDTSDSKFLKTYGSIMQDQKRIHNFISDCYLSNERPSS